MFSIVVLAAVDNRLGTVVDRTEAAVLEGLDMRPWRVAVVVEAVDDTEVFALFSVEPVPAAAIASEHSRGSGPFGPISCPGMILAK